MAKAGLDDGPDRNTASRAASDARREERLAQALRANLKRRKDQARGRDTTASALEPIDDTKG